MVGPDIAEVFKEVGTKVWLNGTDQYEFIDYDLNAQISNPFIREHMVEASLPYNTIIQPGAIIRFDIVPYKFLVVNYIPEIFENQIIEINATLYKCNVYAYIYRENEEAVDETLPMTQRYSRRLCWQLVDETDLVFTSALRGNTSEMLGTQIFADIIVKNNIIYLPASFDIRTKDRIYFDDNDYYEVGNVEKRRFNNVAVASLAEDTRHNNYCGGASPGESL